MVNSLSSLQLFQPEGSLGIDRMEYMGVLFEMVYHMDRIKR